MSADSGVRWADFNAPFESRKLEGETTRNPKIRWLDSAYSDGGVISCKFPLTEKERARQSRELRATAERQAELGRRTQSIAEQGLAELQRKIERGEPLNLSVDQIVSLVTAGVELERRALGEPALGFEIKTARRQGLTMLS